MNITVREPDVHHNHWGIEIRFEADEDCQEIVNEALYMGKNYQVFHQGGAHAEGQYCNKWHYFEFWGLAGHQDKRDVVEEMIEKLREFKPSDWLFWHTCEESGCNLRIPFDDEPKCFTHSPDEGSSVAGYSARAKAKEAAGG